MSLEVGQSFGRYRIVAALGAGGMGEVYRAHDSRLDRDVAIKLLKNVADEAGAKKALLAEARAVSALNHPNVCTVHEVDEIDGQTCLVMELVDGRTLTALAGDARSRSTWPHARTQIAAALAHAHQRGIVHCDLKGENVIVTGDPWTGSKRARDERYSLMVLASIDPDLEALRDHPRFARLGATIVPEPGR